MQTKEEVTKLRDTFLEEFARIQKSVEQGSKEMLRLDGAIVALNRVLEGLEKELETLAEKPKRRRRPVETDDIPPRE